MGDERRETGEAVEHAIRTAHRRLEELFAEVGQAFQELKDIEAAADAFAALREELEVHFEQEDRLYYTTIGTLRPDLRSELEAFSHGHRGFRLKLAALAAHLKRHELEAARRAFRALTADFYHHERAEEVMLASVDRLAAGAS